MMKRWILIAFIFNLLFLSFGQESREKTFFIGFKTDLSLLLEAKDYGQKSWGRISTGSDLGIFFEKKIRNSWFSFRLNAEFHFFTTDTRMENNTYEDRGKLMVLSAGPQLNIPVIDSLELFIYSGFGWITGSLNSKTDSRSFSKDDSYESLEMGMKFKFISRKIRYGLFIFFRFDNRFKIYRFSITDGTLSLGVSMKY